MPGSIRDQAIEWHDRLRDDPSPESWRAFQSWRALHPEHGAEYDQQQRLVEQVAILNMRPSSLRAAPQRRWIAIGGGATALAATLAAILLLGSPAMRGPVVGAPDGRAQAPFGPAKSVRLEDGTIVLLAAYSRVEPMFDRTMRRVRLVGTAARFFAADEAGRPLIVEAGGVRVMATSGVFDVDLSARSARVTAIRGTFTVSAPGATPPGATTLRAGQSLLASEGAVVPAPGDALRRVTLIDADKLMLSDLLRVANSLGDPQIGLKDETLGERRLVGRFDIQDHRALARKLALALDLDAADEGDRIVLKYR